MKRKAGILLALLIVASAPGVSASAQGIDVTNEQAGALGAYELSEALPDSADELVGDIGVMESLDVNRGLGKLWDGVVGKLGEIIGGGLKNAVVIMFIAVLCSVVKVVFGDKSSDYAVLAGVIAISAVCVVSVNSFIGLGRQTLDELDAFSKMLMPVLSAAAASSGALTSAAAKYSATVLFMDVMISVSKSIIVPLIYAYIAVSIGEAALGGEGLSGAAGLIKWIAKTVLAVIVIAFIAYLSITGVITGASDAVAVRAAKFTISTVLPVVGGMIADASETVLAGAAVLRNAVGIFGLIAVAAICVVPFLRLGVNYLLFKAAGGLSGAVAGGKIAKLIDAVGTAFGLMMGVVGVAAMMLFISIISVIKAVS